MNFHQQYSAAADAIETNWARGMYAAHNDKGRAVCLVQALRDQHGTTIDAVGTLHPQILAELDKELSKHRDYRRIKSRQYTFGATAFVHWNDKPRQRQARVVRALRSLAAETERAWLAEQQAAVQRDVVSLTQRIEKLEDTNVRRELDDHLRAVVEETIAA